MRFGREICLSPYYIEKRPIFSDLAIVRISTENAVYVKD